MDGAGKIIILFFFALSVLSALVNASWSVNNILLGRPKHDNFTLAQDPQTALPSYLLLADSVWRGLELGLAECHVQFRWERWDCSDRSALQVVHSGHTEANRETAVVQALVVAGVSHVVSHNCSRGTLPSCTCDNHPKDDRKTEESWQWKGCRHAGAKQGDRVSRALFDGVVDGTDARAAVNLHNNQAGRQAIWRTLELRCKCHGVSGSCSLRTCWHRLPDFRRVGNFLKRRYARAVHADFQDGQLLHGNQARMRSLTMISSKDLVYLVPSPDYCLLQKDLINSRRHPDRRRQTPAALRERSNRPHVVLGNSIVGTLGRECSRPPKTGKASKSERRSCRRLCTECGLKVKRYLVEVVSRCNCKFYWCCTVRCKQCKQVVEKFYCQM